MLIKHLLCGQNFCRNFWKGKPFMKSNTHGGHGNLVIPLELPGCPVVSQRVCTRIASRKVKGPVLGLGSCFNWSISIFHIASAQKVFERGFHYKNLNATDSFNTLAEKIWVPELDRDLANITFFLVSGKIETRHQISQTVFFKKLLWFSRREKVMVCSSNGRGSCKILVGNAYTSTIMYFRNKN